METNKNQLNPKEWVDRYADYLYIYTVQRISDREMAKDIVQETFLAAIKAANNFKGSANEKTWLVAILKRKIVDHYREINSRKGKAEMSMDFYMDGKEEGSWIETQIPQSWNKGIEHKLLNEELGETLTNCLSKLPKKYEIPFTMRTIQQMNSEDICEELNLSTSNFWVLIHRARKQLKKCIETNWLNL